MYTEIKGTRDLNGIHGAGSTISSFVVHEREDNVKCIHRVLLKMENM